MDHQSQEGASARELRIHGPTVRGDFFIADSDNNVWDGNSWRGFGYAMTFATFRAAWIETEKAIAA